MSTPAPLTPNYFPNVYDHPLPDYKPTTTYTYASNSNYEAHTRAQTGESEDEGQGDIEYMDSAKDATPTRRSSNRRNRDRGPTPTSPSRSRSRSSCDGESSSPFDVATPPSIQSYSSAIRETMRKRYEEAYKRMANGDGKMALDLSWEDEDPIDRHVRMISRKSDLEAKARAKVDANGDGEANGNANGNGNGGVKRVIDAGLPSEEMSMLGKAGSSSTTHDDGLPPARPTLLNFRSTSHLTQESRSEDNTPGSTYSESSFEGYSREAWVDMYGRSRSSENSNAASPLVESRPLESPNISFRMSIASIGTFGSNSSSSSQATVQPPRITTTSATTGPYTAQAQTQAQSQSQTPAQALAAAHAYSQPTHPSPSHLFAPLPTPAPLSALATGYFAIPTQTAPAPISRTYPLRPTIGTRQRSRNHPYANALEKQRDQSNSDVRPPVPSPSGLGEYSGRSESELMVIRAGLRSQRTRAGTRV